MSVVNVHVADLRKRGIKNFGEWLSQDDSHVYIGRDMPRLHIKGSVWQNPFTEAKYGRDACLELYENHVRTTPELWNALPTLHNKELGCWCVPDLPCHGQILLRLIEEKMRN